MAIAVDLDKLLDKAYESTDLAKLLDAPVSALAGVSESDAEHLKAAFNIKTVGDLGKNKHFKAAAALIALTEAAK